MGRHPVQGLLQKDFTPSRSGVLMAGHRVMGHRDEKLIYGASFCLLNVGHRRFRCDSRSFVSKCDFLCPAQDRGHVQLNKGVGGIQKFYKYLIYQLLIL